MSKQATSANPYLDFGLRTAAGLILVTLAFFANYQANIFSAAHPGPVIPDTLLDWLPILNVNIIFSEGTYVFIAILVVVAVVYWRRIPFILKTIALFMLTRSFFITLTHLGAIEPHAPLDGSFPKFLSMGHDLFFSGHTGFPFLIALIFWDQRLLRFAFLAMSLIAAFAVLTGHLHYSIDVFAAFYITYGTYKLAVRFFGGDYRLAMNKAE